MYDPALGLLLEMIDRLVAENACGCQIHTERPSPYFEPLGNYHLLRSRNAEARIVDQNIHSVESLQDLVEQPARIHRVCEIGPEAADSIS